MKIWSFLLGMVAFESAGGRNERFLNDCTEEYIPLERVRPLPLGLAATVPVRYYKKMHRLARKNGCVLKVTKRYGLCFLLHKLRGRYGIAAGLVCAFLLCFVMPKLVWHIAYYNIPAEQQKILSDAMYEAGVYEGVWHDNSAFKLAEQKVLLALPQYSWLSFNFARGRLVVEAEDTVRKPSILSEESTNIIAGWDGVIKSMQVYDGYAVKEAGQSVAKGELLVSGVGRDWRQVLHYAKSRAVVTAYVECSFSTIQPYAFQEVEPTGLIDEYTECIINGVQIPLHGPFEAGENDIVQSYQKPCEFLGFSLPATLRVTQVVRQQEKDVRLTKEEAEKRAVTTLNDILYHELKSPVILSKEIKSEECEEGLQVIMKIKAYADIGQEEPL
ncbi:MAG: sporulation protein YqfD [Oscillospiraceae bacterium]|nr:sporulation protein YqfD [Oscillospiraceae bacterium]